MDKKMMIMMTLKEVTRMIEPFRSGQCPASTYAKVEELRLQALLLAWSCGVFDLMMDYNAGCRDLWKVVLA